MAGRSLRGYRAGALFTRRRLLGAALGLPALAFLAACSPFERAQPQPPPTATPTPRPTPTLTPKPAPVRLDTPVAPTATAAPPTAAATPGATPMATTALPRGGEQLLYAGSHDGAVGLVLADFAAGAWKLLVPGRYELPTWSPDGSRLAALGVATPEVQTQQLAIFAADGRALARYPISLAQNLSGLLSWSPDSRALLYRFTDPLNGRLRAWIIDDGGLRTLDLGPDATPWGWTPDGRFAFFVREGGGGSWTPETIVAVWTMTAAGGDPRREVAGPFIPLDWSADGATLYASGELRVGFVAAGGQPAYFPTSLLAIDRASGVRRTLVDLGASVGGVSLGAVAIARDGGPIALVRREAAGGTPTATPRGTLLILDGGGRLIRQALPWSDSDGPRWFAWSPGGRRFSYDAPGPGGREVRISTASGDTLNAYPVSVGDNGHGVRAAWSPDGRWLAFIDRGGIVVAPGDTAEERTYRIAADGNFPAWRPVR